MVGRYLPLWTQKERPYEYDHKSNNIDDDELVFENVGVNWYNQGYLVIALNWNKLLIN